MNANFWTRVDKYPPVLCRLLARHPRRGLPLTDREISDRTSGILPWQLVALIGASTDWGGWEVSMMREFTQACGLDFTDRRAMHRADRYMRGCLTGELEMSKYLRRAPHFKDQLAPLLPIFKRHLLENKHLYVRVP